MNVTIETFFCPYCDEATEIYLRLVNTILFADDENSLRKGIENLKTQVPLDDYFVYGFGAHHLWVHQRPSDQSQYFRCRLMKAEFYPLKDYDNENKNDSKRSVDLPDRRRTPRVFYPLSFPSQKETALSIRLPRCGRRTILLRRPDIGGVPDKTGYVVR